MTSAERRLYELEVHDGFPRSAAIPGTLTWSQNDSSCDVAVLRLVSDDGVNRLTSARVAALTAAVEELAARPPARLVITGNAHFFSAGADLNQIAALTGPQALDFARMGQRLMNAVADFPAPTIAAVHGYCMGGGFDLALACSRRIAGPHAVFGHRGAALGLVTGWGGTQRLPRLIGKARALQMFLTAEKVGAQRALEIGLADAVADDPLAVALKDVGTPGSRPFFGR